MSVSSRRSCRKLHVLLWPSFNPEGWAYISDRLWAYQDLSCRMQNTVVSCCHTPSQKNQEFVLPWRFISCLMFNSLEEMESSRQILPFTNQINGKLNQQWNGRDINWKLMSKIGRTPHRYLNVRFCRYVIIKAWPFRIFLLFIAWIFCQRWVKGTLLQLLRFNSGDKPTASGKPVEQPKSG